MLRHIPATARIDADRTVVNDDHFLFLSNDRNDDDDDDDMDEWSTMGDGGSSSNASLFLGLSSESNIPLISSILLGWYLFPCSSRTYSSGRAESSSASSIDSW